MTSVGRGFTVHPELHQTVFVYIKCVATNSDVCFFFFFIITFSCWLATSTYSYLSQDKACAPISITSHQSLMARDTVKLEARDCVSFLPSYSSMWCRRQSILVLAVWMTSLSSVKQSVAKTVLLHEIVLS